MNQCKNCDQRFEGNFCNHCGQSSKVKRITLKQLTLDAFVSSIDLENGLLNTISKLSIQPGKSLVQYLEGKRKALYPPFKYLLLIGALSTFIAVKLQLFSGTMLEGLHLIEYQNTIKFIAYTEEYTTLINIVAIPIFAFYSRILLQQYNFTEHLVLNLYITAHQLFFWYYLSHFTLTKIASPFSSISCTQFLL